MSETEHECCVWVLTTDYYIISLFLKVTEWIIKPKFFKNLPDSLFLLEYLNGPLFMEKMWESGQVPITNGLHLII